MSLAVSGCLPLMAQNPVVNNPDNKPYFGIRVGGEVTCPGKLTEDNIGVSAFKNGGGVEFGGIYNAPVAANFYLEPGLKLYYNTYSMKEDFTDSFKYSIKKFGLRIPVMAGYHFDFTQDIQVSLFTGPELEIGLSAKECVKAGNVEESNNLYSDSEGMKRVDVLWGIGAGISYRHLYFGVKGGIGMLNMLKESEVKFHENRVTFSLGYNF